MMRSLTLAAWLLGAVLVAQAPAPTVQNGRVDSQAATSIDAALRALPTSSDPVWVGWRVPMVSTSGTVCSTWSDGGDVVRGSVLEPKPASDGRPLLTPPSGPVALESGTGLLVMLRVVDGRVERLRSFSDDCPIDAAGTSVRWIDGITPAESLRYLAALTRPDPLTASGRRLAPAAIGAAALHASPDADALLDTALAADRAGEWRMAAARALARLRGRHGYDVVARAIDGEQDASARRQLANALAQSPEPMATTKLLTLARSDTNSGVRAEALSGYASRTGAPGIATVLDLVNHEASPDVQRRGIEAIGRLPSHAGIPTMIDVAGSASTLAARKAAVGALSRSDDPRALTYLEGIVSGKTP
jgi:hypothetical protein